MKRIIFLFVLGIFAELFIMVFIQSAEGAQGDLQAKSVSLVTLLFGSPPTPTPTPTPAFNQPVRLEIPSIGLSADIEAVGLDNFGVMVIPENPRVGWYGLSARPGWGGNVVIAGHYDTASGAAAVFFNLDKIPLGAEIMFTDELGRTMKYVVDRSESRPIGNWSLEEIFGQTGERRLSLITCSGWWNPSIRTYSHRHIVFARLISP